MNDKRKERHAPVFLPSLVRLCHRDAAGTNGTTQHDAHREYGTARSEFEMI